MGKEAAPQSREERLAERLRENLRRRKQQARELAGGSTDGPKPQDKIAGT